MTTPKSSAVRKYNVALVQMSMGPDPEANFASAVRHIREAARLGAHIVCLPELFRAQYFCQREDLRLFDLAEPIPGPSTEKLAAVARESQIAIVASLFERRGPGLYHNTAVTLDAEGKLAGVYRKMHIPDDPLYYEKYYFAPGDLGFQALNVQMGSESGRIGTLVCWDQWFPEAARLTVLQGAELLFYPTAIGWHPAEKEQYGAAQYDAWQTIQRAHAIANGVYVAAVNRVGHEHGEVKLSQGEVLGVRASGPGLEFWGGSFLADPFGRVIAKASHDAEEILLGEIDLGLIEETRRNWPFLRDRRIDAYAPITQRFIDLDVEPKSGKPQQPRFKVGAHHTVPVDPNLVARQLMTGRRLESHEIDEARVPGIYVFFIKNRSDLPMIKVPDSNLLYIGMTKSELSGRNPLFHKDSSGHSVRRSIGALLKGQLGLHAIPRSDGSIANYRFGDAGEERLSRWMEANLTYNCVPVEQDISQVELALIEQLCPPLNLTNPSNPNAEIIKKARGMCQAEASSSRTED